MYSIGGKAANFRSRGGSFSAHNKFEKHRSDAPRSFSGPGNNRGGPGRSFSNGPGARGRGALRGGRAPTRRGGPPPRTSNQRGLESSSRVVVVPFEAGNRVFEGVFIAKGKADAIVTKNLTPGESVYAEKRIETITDTGEKTDYRVWNVFRSKLGASIVGGISTMPIKPGSKVLYLGAANGTTVSHVSDIVGPEGAVYAVEFSHRSARDLTNLAKKRANIIPIVEDARMPWRYRIIVSMVDVIFSDVAQPDQSRIVALNASYFLKTNGFFMISIKASCVDSTVSPESIYASEIDALRKENCKTREQLTLEPYHKDHSMIMGRYRPSKKADDK